VKVTFDRLPPGGAYPLSQRQVREIVRAIAPAGVAARITRVHFGCNRKSAQEARIVARPGHTFTIRLDFWLEDGRSPLWSRDPGWLEEVRTLGGVIPRDSEFILWPEGSARGYAAFLIAHEIAHAVYADERGEPDLTSGPDLRAEETWCDRWARQAVSSLAGRLERRR